MTDLYRQLQTLVGEGAGVAVATIIRTAGSVPREVGAKMIISADGRNAGTVGGGCGEAAVMRAALDVIASRQATIVRVDLTDDVQLKADGVCGGILDVLVEPWPPAGESPTHAAAILEQIIAGGEPQALLTRLPPASTAHVLLSSSAGASGDAPADVIEPARALLAQRRCGIVTAPAGEWFVEVSRATPKLVIVGAGHIAAPLAQMAGVLGWRVVVIDDRPSFANAQRFPTAEIRCGSYDVTLRQMPIDADTYIVIVTRGHQHDVESLLAVLDSPAAYIGMIGSRRRVNGVFDLLEHDEGIAPSKLARVHAPIGLDIEAVTPAEIAVSILAEIVKVYRGGRAESMSDYRRR